MEEQKNEFQAEEQIELQQEDIAVSNGKGFAVASLVLGIIGIVFSFFTFINLISLACAIIGIVCSVIGRTKSKKATGKVSGIATAGLVLSIIGTVFSALGAVCTIACIGTATSIGCFS